MQILDAPQSRAPRLPSSEVTDLPPLLRRGKMTKPAPLLFNYIGIIVPAKVY